jgi:glutamyl-Q tRNA(Asp) synthetase
MAIVFFWVGYARMVDAASSAKFGWRYRCPDYLWSYWWRRTAGDYFTYSPHSVLISPVAVTRFAPSPTGYLHLGHAYSALFAAEASGGDTFLLRIEDLDPLRCKPEFTDAIIEDLGWLGLKWRQPIRIQSQHMDDYASILKELRERKLLYPCFCTRSEIKQEAECAAHAPHAAEGGFIYPGTCRQLSEDQRAEKLTQQPANWRLDIGAAKAQTGALFWR